MMAVELPTKTDLICLRDYQILLIKQLYNAWKSGCRRVLMQLPTGGGKTVIFSKVARDCLSRGKGVLVVAHRLELITQAKNKLEEASGIPCGVIKAGFPVEEHLPLQVASIQSLSRRKRYPEAGLIIIDEAHHAVSKSYTDLMEQYPNAFILGVTATPCRTDGQGFKFLFDELITGPSVSQLINNEHLSKFRIFAAASKISTKGIRKTGGDYNVSQLEAAANAITGEVVPTWRKYAEGKKTIIFCVSVDHSKAVVAEFIKEGITAEHLDGETPDEERKQALSRFRSGETTVLSNCGLFTEGFDLPSIEAVQVLRPTMSLILHLQILGRSLRPSPGKEHALIIDHTDNWIKHGLPDDPREWSLEPISLKPALFVQQCPKCFHGFRVLPHEQKSFREIVDAAGKVKSLFRATCPNCLTIFEWEQGEGLEIGGGKPIEKEQGEIAEVDVTLTPDHKKLIDEVVAIAIEKNYKPGWVYNRLIENHTAQFAKFTFGDLRYLGTKIKLDIDKAKKKVKQAQGMLDLPDCDMNKINPQFVDAIAKLNTRRQERNYQPHWIYYRLEEDCGELAREATYDDWVYLGQILGYPKTWAYGRVEYFKYKK